MADIYGTASGTNQFLDLKLIARQTLARLINNLVMPNLCYTDFGTEFVNGLGNKIQVKKPIDFTANEFTVALNQGGASGQYNEVTPQNIVEESVEVVLDKMADVTIDFGALVGATQMGAQKMNNILEGMAVALAKKMNIDGLKEVINAGTFIEAEGTTGGVYAIPSALKDFSNIRLALNKKAAHLDGRYAVWSPDADAQFTQLGNLVKVNESGTAKALRDGEIGRVYGLTNYMAQDTYVQTGTFVAADSTTFSVSGKTITLSKAATTAPVVGEVLKITDGTSTQYATVVSYDSSTKVITFDRVITIKNASAVTKFDGTLNLAAHRDGIALVTRPLMKPSSAQSWVESWNGISLRVVQQYDIMKKREVISMDILYNYKTIRPELVVGTIGA